MLAMVTVAVTTPRVLGVKVTWKGVLPVLAATVRTGDRVMRKAPALAPLSVTNGVPVKLRAAVPLLRTVKVVTTWLLIITLPKSVPSAAPGVVSPLVMLMALPWRSISGARPMP